MAVQSNKATKAQMRFEFDNMEAIFHDELGNPVFMDNQGNEMTLQINTQLRDKQGNELDPRYGKGSIQVNEDYFAMLGNYGDQTRKNLKAARAVAKAKGLKSFTVNVGTITVYLIDEDKLEHPTDTDADKLLAMAGVSLDTGKAKKNSANAAQLADLLKM